MTRRELIVMTIHEVILQYERTLGDAQIWEQPLAAFAAAEDPGFSRLKEAVSASHLLPHDILPGAKTVVSFFIPFQERIIKSNGKGESASREWAETYIRTNELIGRISGELASLLEHEGFHAGQIPATHNFDEKRLVSDWSHRHAAHIAGLGTFGINNMLITERGCCGRFGSLVTDWEAPEITAPPPLRERCLHKRGGSCGLCREKCPAGAYSGGVFDRRVCYQRCLQNGELYRDLGLADVCGKCLCGLPCSRGIPVCKHG
jgi:epoxyqueuosine reductase QueG